MSKADLLWPNSLWKVTAEPLPNLDKLPGNIDTDLLIIGAGYTGLSSALHSIDAIKNIVVIDQAQPGWGCSGRNGGQINLQWKPALGQLRKMFPGEDFSRFIKTVDQSASLVFELIEKHQIKCQALRQGCVIPSKGKKGRRYLSTWHAFWKEYGADVKLLGADDTQRLIGTKVYDTSMLDLRGGSL